MSDWETDLLQGLAQYLTTTSVGTYRATGAYQSTDVAIVFGELPTQPDRAISLTLYGSSDEPVQNLSSVRVQLMMRGTPNASLDVGSLATSAFSQLQGLSYMDFGSAHVLQVRRVSAVPLGLDGNKRSMRADNYVIDVNTTVGTFRTD